MKQNSNKKIKRKSKVSPSVLIELIDTTNNPRYDKTNTKMK